MSNVSLELGSIQERIRKHIESLSVILVQLFPTRYSSVCIIVVRKLLSDRRKFREDELSKSLSVHIKDIREEMYKLNRDGVLECEEIKVAELEKSEGFAAALAATRNMVTTAAPAPLTTQEARKIIKQYCWWINETLLFKKLLCRFRQVLHSFDSTMEVEESWNCTKANCPMIARQYNAFEVQDTRNTVTNEFVCSVCGTVLTSVAPTSTGVVNKTRFNLQAKVLKDYLVTLGDLIEQQKKIQEKEEKNRLDLEAAIAAGRVVTPAEVQSVAMPKKSLAFLSSQGTTIKSEPAAQVVAAPERNEESFTKNIQLLQQVNSAQSKEAPAPSIAVAKSVLVNGVSKLVSDVTQEDIDSMSNDEYDAYNLILQG